MYDVVIPKSGGKISNNFFDFLREKSVLHARSRASPEHASHFVRAWSNTDIDFSIIINILVFYKRIDICINNQEEQLQWEQDSRRNHN